MNELRICKYCKSWAPDDNRDIAAVGECRKRAPVAMVEVPNRGYRPWINTGNADWCREFDTYHGDE